MASVDEAVVGRCADIRRRIHRDPELSGQEFRTRDIILEELQAAGWQATALKGCAGVTAVLPGPARGPCLALRADMDALPLQETSGLPWASQSGEVMHACGHDGHTALLLGVARHLAAAPPRCDVKLLFQPAEERGDGAQRMLEEGVLSDPKVDAVFGLHGWPDLPLGTIAVHPGPVMASVDNFDITVIGKGGHGAQPQHTLDPIVGAAQLIVAAQSLVSRSVDPLESAVLTIGHVRGGHTYNVIPEECRLQGTLRAHHPAVRARLRANLDRLREGVCRSLGLDSRVTWDENCPATINHPAMAALARRAAVRAAGESRVLAPQPSMAGEDFSYFLEKIPGAYVWLGLGDGRGPLHNPRFDFNDAALGTGIAFFLSLIEEWAAG